MVEEEKVQPAIVQYQGDLVPQDGGQHQVQTMPGFSVCLPEHTTHTSNM